MEEFVGYPTKLLYKWERFFNCITRRPFILKLLFLFGEIKRFAFYEGRFKGTIIIYYVILKWRRVISFNFIVKIKKIISTLSWTYKICWFCYCVWLFHFWKNYMHIAHVIGTNSEFYLKKRINYTTEANSMVHTGK